MGNCCSDQQQVLQNIQNPKRRQHISPTYNFTKGKQIKNKIDNKIEYKILIPPLNQSNSLPILNQQNYLDKNKDNSNYYNEKIDNTVRDSEIQSQKHNLSFTQQQNFNRKGLPNIGNTCFLNSVIQMLFSAPKIRNTILQLSKKNPHFKTHNLLSDILIDIQQNGQTNKKRQNLLKLSFRLEQKIPHLVYKSQQDFLDCFLNIIAFLQEENSKVSNFLTFRLSQICKCNKNRNVIQRLNMSSQSFCALCHQSMNIIIDNPSPYMLFVLKLNEPKFKKEIKFVNKSGRKFIYKVISYIIYFGNQSSGHYYVCRQDQSGQWLRISDQKVQKCKDYDKPKNMPMICLYKYQQNHS